MDVTCICMTHGRPWLLAEAVESFRRQDLCGLKAELLILNDCPEQHLTCDVPGVRIVTMQTPYSDLAEKTNAIFLLAKGEYLCWWDDDDISLPNRIERQYRQIVGNTIAFVRPKRFWSMSYGRIDGFGGAVLCASMLRRRSVLEVGGCTPGEFNDQSLFGKLSKLFWCEEESAVWNINFIYRWGGVGYHDSGAGEQDAKKRAASFRAAALRDVRFRRGVHRIEPMWMQDYEAAARGAALVAEALEQQEKQKGA